MPHARPFWSRLLAALTVPTLLLVVPAGASAATTRSVAEAPPSSTPGTLATTTPSVAQYSSITFSYSVPEANVNSENWIGVYSESGGCAPVDGTDVCGSTTYQYVGDESGTASFDTSLLPPGTYYAYLLYDNGYDSLAPDVTFTVTAGTPPGTLGESTTSLTQGASITFAYSTPSNFDNDENWIGIYSNPGCGPVNGVSVCGSTIWQYTPNDTGTATFSTGSLSPGQYVAYYLYDNGYVSLAKPIDFTVKALKPGPPPTFSSAVTTKPTLDDPHGVVQGPGGRLWVADTGANKVEEISATTGRIILTLGGRGSAPGRLDQPRAVALYGRDVFVADTGHNRVEEYTKKGTFVATIGARGTATGDFISPEGVAAHAGVLYVSDDGNNRIETFSTSTRTYEASMTAGGDVSSPGGLSINKAGDIWADQQGQTDTALDGVLELSPAGKVLLALDDDNTTGYGGFNDPTDVATDAAGNIFVAEPDLELIQEFTPTGVFDTEFGYSGKGTLASPVGLTVTNAGQILVADSGNDRLVSFKEP